jgi:hypothetical protein
MKQVACTLLGLLLVIPARAEWKQTDNAREYEACIPECEKNSPREHDRCVNYCRCVTDRMQTQFPDRDRFLREVVEQKLPAPTADLQKIVNRCNQQIWKNPARRLKFH